MMGHPKHLPGEITLLISSGPLLTKQYVRQGDGSISTRSYGKAKIFETRSDLRDSLVKIESLLKQAKPEWCAIRGGLIEGKDPKKVRRTIHPREDDPNSPYFEEVPRSWAMLDFDNIVAPDYLNATDPRSVADYLILNHLPDEFWGAGYVVQLSCGHLIPGNEGKIKAHLWVLLDRPVSDAELKVWLGDCPVDCALFHPVQIHYIAPPVLKGVDDPCPVRIYRSEGPPVTVPEIQIREDRYPNRGTMPLHRGPKREASEEQLKAFAEAAVQAYIAGPGKDLAHHRYLSAISSVLCRSGFKEEVIATVIEAVAGGTDAADPDSRRDRACLDTIKRLKQGNAKVPGRPVLQEEYGFDINTAMRKHLGVSPVDLAVDELNQQYAMFSDGVNTGHVADLRVPAKPAVLRTDQLDKKYANDTVPVHNGDAGPKRMPKSTIWKTSPRRRRISEIVFEPPGSPFPVPTSAHNRWQGFAVEPVSGDSHLPLLGHINENVCQGDQALFDWLMDWLADMMQQPGDKPGTAVALRGTQGCGKTIIVDYLRGILGSHAMTVSDAQRVTGKFNSILGGLVLLGFEEGFWAGNKVDESVLKDLITASTVTVEAKFVNAYDIHAHARVLTTSNESWAVPTSPGDRRWAVFNVLPSRSNDNGFWTPIWDALYSDGPAHLLHHLLDRKYDKAYLRRPPMTQAKVEQTLHSLDTVGGWWYDVLRGVRLAGTPLFEEEMPKDCLFEDYTAWCLQCKRRSTANSFFWKRMHELTDSPLKEIRKRNGRDRRRDVEMPSLVHCQHAFAAAMCCDWSELDAEV